MKGNSTATIQTITSSKAVEREIATAIKLFQGKETEFNWEKREQMLLLIDSLLQHDSFPDWQPIIVQGVRDLVYGLADAIQSLRTKYALVAFDLITTIGNIIGTQLDTTTFETLVNSLLRCGNSSKQIIANKAKDTMVSFLSTTTYHNRTINLLFSAFADKNHQARHFIAIYMETYLQTHTPRTLVRSTMERQNTLATIELFLKTGLLDATPAVRQVCRRTFWIYHNYWPRNADRLLQRFDTGIKKQVEQQKPTKVDTAIDRNHVSNVTPGSPEGVNRLRQRKLLSSPLKLSPRSNRTKVNMDNNDSNTIKRPASPNFTTDHPTRQRKLSRSLTASPQCDRVSEYSPALASASLLHMLRSSNVTINCKGLNTLAKCLSESYRRPALNNNYDGVLPSTVPSRVDLIPILQSYLSFDRMLSDDTFCEQLMSWDILCGIYAQILSLQHFLPTVILAGERRHRNGLSNNTSPLSQRLYTTCASGCRRLKLYLKYNDPTLMKSLLDILLMATTFDGAGLRDPNAKKELLKTTLSLHHDRKTEGHKAQDDLVFGLVTWLDELVCTFVGLNDDEQEDQQLMDECKQAWKTDTVSDVATSWLDDNDNLTSCLELILGVVHSYLPSAGSSAVFTTLMTLIGRLRLANIRVFDAVIRQADDDTVRLLDTCLGRPRSLYNDIDQSKTIGLLDENIYDHNVPPPSYSDVMGLERQEESDLLDNDQDDVRDTSLGSIHLEVMSPEPSLTTTQGPSDMDNNDDDMVPRIKKEPSRNLEQSISSAVVITTIETNHATSDKGLIHQMNSLSETTEQFMMRTNKSMAIYEQLESLCKKHDCKDEKNKDMWRSTSRVHQDGNLLGLLVHQLTEELLQGDLSDNQRIGSLRLLEHTLIYQAELVLQHMDDYGLVMTKAFIYTKQDNFGQIALLVDQVQHLLLNMLTTKTCASIFTQLLKQDKGLSSCKGDERVHPLSNLFNMINKVASRIMTLDMVENLFVQNECVEIFIKGINHSLLCVRQSCVNALVSLSFCLGNQEDIKNYLPGLRKDQCDLLDHYIQMAKK